jgi:hypothetical protein
MLSWSLRSWSELGLKKYLATWEAWVDFASDHFRSSLSDLIDYAFARYNPTLEEWVALTNDRFGEDIDAFKAAAYNYRIKQEAAAADSLGIGDRFRYGSEVAKAEQEALSQIGKPKTKILTLGKSTEERLLEREDLLITNMVKKAASEAKVELEV